MAYIFKQKFDIRHLVDVQTQIKKVFVAESEEYLSALYARHLRQNDYEVGECSQPSQFEYYFRNFNPHLLIINANYFGEASRLARILLAAASQMQKIPVITLGIDLSGEHVKSLMAAGVTSHIDRRFSRPQDIVFLTNSLLKNL